MNIKITSKDVEATEAIKAYVEKKVEKLAKFYLEAGVKGLYVGGSSGECIYQSLDERKLVLEHVMKAVGDDLTIIARWACNQFNGFFPGQVFNIKTNHKHVCESFVYFSVQTNLIIWIIFTPQCIGRF